DNNNGSPIGTNANGNVITSNSAVNLIFDTYQVKSMSYFIGQWYTIVFDGDITGLKNILDNLNDGVETTDLIGVAMLLENTSFEKPKAIISPNPFSYNFDIQSEQIIANYSIIDITGKTIIATSSKANLDNQSSQLSAGMYILNLDFDNGQKANYKLVKK
ncbi:MAG: T9SS type A sorting domain-containing protein, partial [Flavobacterium sp.]|uniref:T9SS type A sorting domain-containing protein n=1 Tax=Flavobacterium sp. TaxID=239 RepID=UPI003BC7D423